MVPPPDSSTQPLVIRKSDSSKVEIEWADGGKTSVSAALLRRLCQCAACVQEWTGEALLDPASVPEDLTQNSLALVGNYGISVRFSDGHDTGIYTFTYIRENCPTES